MPGGRGGRHLAPISSGAGTQFRYLFSGHHRIEAAHDASIGILWLSCIKSIAEKTGAVFVTTHSLGSQGGVVTWQPARMIGFSKPCSEERANQ